MLDKLLIFSWRSCYIAHLSLRRAHNYSVSGGGGGVGGWGRICCLFLAELLRDIMEKHNGTGVRSRGFPVCSRLLPRFGRLSRDIKIGEVDKHVWKEIRSDAIKGEVYKDAGGARTKPYRFRTTLLTVESLQTRWSLFYKYCGFVLEISQF